MAANNGNGNGGIGDRVAATGLEFLAPTDLRIDGKTYRQGERIPAKYGRAMARGEMSKDPAWNSALAPPNMGRVVIPNSYTFGSRQSLISKTYRNPDEAMRHSVSNARAMTRDLVVWGCIEARQRGTVLLNWHLEVEDKNDPQQKELVDELTKIVASTWKFAEYRRNLMDAIWYGRFGIQHQYGFQYRNGKRYTYIKHWQPINGDKLLFRYDDGSGTYDPDQVGIKTSYIHPTFDAVAGARKIEMTEQGAGYFLEPWERSLWAIHKHTIEDGLFEDVLSSGRIHGVGIRDRIYWQWFQRQSALAMLMELVERTGNGYTVYYYQYGNPEAKSEMANIAKNHGRDNAILIPRVVGDPSMDSNGIEVIPANTAGIDALKELIDGFYDEQTVRYILGQTLTTRASATGLGSGLAELHHESFTEIVKYDAGNLEESITAELIEPLKRFNFPWARDIQVQFRIDTQETDAEAKLAAIKNLWDMGAEIKAEDAYNAAGISKPTADDDVLMNPQLAGGGMPMPGQGMPGDPMAGGDDGMDGDSGSAESYDPHNNEHLFGAALQAAGVSGGQPGDDGSGAAKGRFGKARYKVAHAPEGGAAGGGKEYKGGQFTPQDATGKGKPVEQPKGMKATAGQQALEAGMLKHGFTDKPITNAERGQLWALAKANLGNDASLPQEMRGMFVTLQMTKDARDKGVVHTDRIDQNVAGKLFNVMASEGEGDKMGGHVRQLGNASWGFSGKSGALIITQGTNGRFSATYTPMTHVVRSSSDAGGAAPDAQNFDTVRDDGFGPELGADELGIDQGDGYGPELGAEEMQIDPQSRVQEIGPDTEDATPAPTREPGDEDEDDEEESDPSGFGPQPKTGGPTAAAKKLNKRSEIGKAIMSAAAEHGVDEDELNEAVEHVWNMHRESHAQHEEAMTAVRKWFGITQRDVNKMENSGRDYTSIKGFDVIARAAASAYPQLGLGMGRVDFGEGAVKEDEGLEEALWNALKAGAKKLPTRQDVVGEAAEWLSQSKKERERVESQQREELEAVPFRKFLGEMFRAKYNHAPEGGMTSNVNGQFYDGGQFMPITGEFAGKGRNRVTKSEIESANKINPKVRFGYDEKNEVFFVERHVSSRSGDSWWQRQTSARNLKPLLAFAKYAKKIKPAKNQAGFDFESSSPLTDGNGHLHAPKGGATVNGKDFEGGEFIPPGDVAAASEEEKQDLKEKQVEAVAESMKKAAGKKFEGFHARTEKETPVYVNGEGTLQDGTPAYKVTMGRHAVNQQEYPDYYGGLAALYDGKQGLIAKSKIRKLPRNISDKSQEGAKEPASDKPAAGSTNLFGDEVRDKPRPAKFEDAKGKQGKMFSGMDALPGQTDLFEDMDNVNARDEEEPAAEEPAAEPELSHEDDYKQNGTRSKAFKSWFGDWEGDPKNASKVVDDDGAPQMNRGPAVKEVYHGTTAEFDAFDKSKAGQHGAHAGSGFYFSENPRIARSFSKRVTYTKPPGEAEQKNVVHGKVIEAYLSIKNPLDFESEASDGDVDKWAEAGEKALGTGEKGFLTKDFCEYMQGVYDYHKKKGKKITLGTLWSSAASHAWNNKSDVNKIVQELGYDGLTHLAMDDRGSVKYSDDQSDFGRVWVAFEPKQIKATENRGTFDPADERINYARSRVQDISGDE